MRSKTLFPILLVLVTLAACSPLSESVNSSASLSIWIDAPLDDSILPLAPYEIVAHASDPAEINSLEVYINDILLASFSNPSPDNLLLTIHQEWEPSEPGEYEIRARSRNSAGEWSDYAVAHVLIEENYSPISLELVPTETSEIDLVNCDPSLTAISNTTCRLGPSAFHPPAAYLNEDESAAIIGRNQDWSWWLAELPHSTEPCWIAASTVTTICPPEDMVLVDSPPYISRIIKSNQEFYWGDHHQKSITIQAQVAGESPVEKVVVIYQITGSGNWNSVLLSNTSSDIWEGAIHAHNVTDYRKVSASFLQYYLQATSENGLSMQSEIFSDIKLKQVYLNELLVL